jgi:hypothetical protein
METKWEDGNVRYKGRLAERLMAERCLLETKAIPHFSALNFSAIDMERHVLNSSPPKDGLLTKHLTKPNRSWLTNSNARAFRRPV